MILAEWWLQSTANNAASICECHEATPLRPPFSTRVSSKYDMLLMEAENVNLLALPGSAIPQKFEFVVFQALLGPRLGSSDF